MKAIVRSLFFKIFVSFWIAMMLISAGFALIYVATSNESRWERWQSLHFDAFRLRVREEASKLGARDAAAMPELVEALSKREPVVRVFAVAEDELPRADVVVIAAPHTRETSHLVGGRELALLKDGAVLVNVSRGTLIDEAALARELARGRIRAALDVFEHEPLAPASPLWGSPHVLITPHVAGFFADYWPAAVATFAENLRRFEKGEPLVNLVDKRAGY